MNLFHGPFYGIMTFDIIISGLGCAGLSLVNYVLDSPLNQKAILLIGNEGEGEKNKTWCYWAETPLAIHPSVKPLVAWKNLKFIHRDDKISTSLDHLNYYKVSAEDFYKEIWEKINQYPGITYINDFVEDILQEDGSLKIKTKNSGCFLGKKVFNSIQLPHMQNHSRLNQVFLGWEIKSDRLNLNKDAVTLMHFDSKNGKEMGFTYILPFNQNHALVEYTLFSKNKLPSMDIMEAEIKKYIHSQWGITDYSITYREQGVIPMSTFPPNLKDYQNLYHIGSIAGWTKPSTGYTFHKIQTRCQSIVNNLLDDKRINKHAWERAGRFKFYDNILLNIAYKWPEKLPEVFLDLFRKNAAKNILKFLNEETSLWEEIRLLAKLRFRIFIRSLIHYDRY
ncbi:lycopene cyclase family protein [Pleomorphovibrio marinus]|uniref:lycopene cyclase family protein n=1 Tax=Pleomorphovibrio marinus TaxID=2164132 RepID=UPI000E0A4EBF|nr:lycopene cyclase family protein [Pleomorphovibrio marinus]